MYKMSSVLRSIAQKKEGITKFIKPESPCYYDSSIDDNRLFPFVYSNGVLDISYDGNNFKSEMVDNTGNSPNSETTTAVRILSGPRLVTALGENFKAYIRAWRNGSIDVNSPIEIYIPSQVIRVQEADINNINSDSGDSYRISEAAPIGDNYMSGSAANGYNTTYAFKTPLTFSIKEGGITKYITFRTIMDQE